jgi:(R)-amidase
MGYDPPVRVACLARRAAAFRLTGVYEVGTTGINVLLAQLEPERHDVAANTATVTGLLAAYPDADLAVFPEMYLHGYLLKGVLEHALNLSSAPVAAIQAAARETSMAVIVGMAEKVGAGMTNSALCIDRTGEIAAVYRKVHLFGPEVHYFVPGESYTIASLCGLRVAPLICYDIEFPEPARAVAETGIDLLVSIAANMAPYVIEHDLCHRVRAMENRVPHVYVNGVGHEAGLDFLGRSGVADPAGNLVVGLAADVRDVRAVRVEIGEAPYPDYLTERRPGIPVRALRPAAQTSP